MAVTLTPAAALTTWQFAPLVSVPLAVCAALYLTGTRTVARAHPARPWPVVRGAAFLAGLAVIAIAICGADGVYDDLLLRAHMVQHLLLIMVAPPLLVYGRPVTLLLHATRNPWHGLAVRVVRSRVVSALTWPPGCVLLYAAVVLGTHLSPLILATGWPHDVEHLAYLLAGYLFFLPVVGSEPARWRPSLFSRYLLLLAAMPADIITGAALMLAPPFGGYSAADVHMAGLIMLSGSEAIMTALAAALAVNLIRAPASRVPAPDLAEYNTSLAALEPGPPWQTRRHTAGKFNRATIFSRRIRLPVALRGSSRPSRIRDKGGREWQPIHDTQPATSDTGPGRTWSQRKTTRLDRPQPRDAHPDRRALDHGPVLVRDRHHHARRLPGRLVRQRRHPAWASFWVG